MVTLTLPLHREALPLPTSRAAPRTHRGATRPFDRLIRRQHAIRASSVMWPHSKKNKGAERKVPT
eukprot:12136852-Alexandrium_andersonii.AAC.1